MTTSDINLAMPGPVQIVSVRDDNTLVLHDDALKSVLLQDKFKDMPVAVVAVAGKYRQGKSFLLGFFLRYLQNQDCSEWLKNTDVMTGGFQWKASPSKVTSGIYIWSEPMVVTVPCGERVAVLLMGTQGTDDTSTNAAQDVPIFALSALLSSALVFNVKDIGMHDMESIKLFLGYAGLAVAAKSSETYDNKPFQALHFLVRDWHNPKTHVYGLKGGGDYLNIITDQVEGLRNALFSTYSQFTCFLMPHPGATVAGDDFKGDIKDVDKIFLENIRKFVPLVLGKVHLAVKEDIGRRITVGQLLDIFTEYFIFFADGMCPVPETLFEANRTKSYVHALSVAKAMFERDLASYEHSKYVGNIEKELRSMEEASFEEFRKVKKLASTTELDEKYLAELGEYTRPMVKALIDMNDVKKQIMDLKIKYQMKSKEANEKIRKIGDDIGRMKENQITEKRESQKKIEELKSQCEQEKLRVDSKIEKLQESQSNSKKMLLEAQRDSEMKTDLMLRAELAEMKNKD